MVGQAEQNPDHDGSFDVPGDEGTERAAFSGLLEDSAEDLYENAPCGYLSTLLDGRIAKVNTTLLRWLGHQREDLVGRRRFADLLTVREALPRDALPRRDLPTGTHAQRVPVLRLTATS